MHHRDDIIGARVRWPLFLLEIPPRLLFTICICDVFQVLSFSLSTLELELSEPLSLLRISNPSYPFLCCILESFYGRYEVDMSRGSSGRVVGIAAALKGPASASPCGSARGTICARCSPDGQWHLAGYTQSVNSPASYATAAQVLGAGHWILSYLVLFRASQSSPRLQELTNLLTGGHVWVAIWSWLRIT